jgi:hypothetical protein
MVVITYTVVYNDANSPLIYCKSQDIFVLTMEVRYRQSSADGQKWLTL